MDAVNAHYKKGLALYEAGRVSEALDAFREALRETDSCEVWNDWAAAQFTLGKPDEAEVGFRLALEIDPAYQLATDNLAALLESQTRLRQGDNEVLERDRIATFLASCVPEDPNERSYFETHHNRYLETLKMLPSALPGQKLLELGAAFHHLTPALRTVKGYTSVRCNDIWQGAHQVTRELRCNREEKLQVEVDNFDVQTFPWPYEDASFDAVLFCEMLEHLHSDPMAVVAEINRVLRPNGVLLLTTPNLASCHSVEYAVRGESPYVYGKFEPNGKPTDRHNREYTPHEARRLVGAAGFECARLETQYSWWQADRSVLRLLASRGEPISLRGDNIFLLARKLSAVRERYPEEFYLKLGTQAERRVLQERNDPIHRETNVAALTPQNLLVVHEVVPHFDQSGSDLRLLDVLKELRAQSHHVTLLARDASNVDKYAPALEELGIRVVAGAPERVTALRASDSPSWSSAEFLREQKFDVAILFHWFWRGISIAELYLADIRRFSPRTRVAILTDDRHGERERRAAKLSQLFSDRERAEDFETRELAAYEAADLLLYISEADRRLFQRFLPDLPMEQLPLVAPAVPQSRAPFAARSGVLFLGNFENLANRDALDWFLKEIWPLVRKRLPELVLRVAGNACPANLATADNNVAVLGKLADLAESFSQALAFVSPIRFGTGINTKNLQALARGLPTVTTSIGAEGLRLRDGQQALLADTPLSFANAVCRVCTEADLWRALSENGKSYVASHFSREHLSSCIRESLTRMAAIPPRRDVPARLSSYRKVEQTNPEVLTAEPPSYCLVLRTLAYWQQGVQALSGSDPRGAIEQFRHIFTSLRGALPDTTFHRRLLTDMAEAYRRLGESSSAGRCESELTRLIPLGRAKNELYGKRVEAQAPSSGSPLISVVIPTFNRRETLGICLAALAFQTLPAFRWEVIVVDDGSADETASFLAAAQFPFPLRVIRQANQGAGAARRAGVFAASGEYILFCNDDTIASSTLLEEHLRLQQQHAGPKLAILGSFFPSSECARRALSFWTNHSSFLFPHQTLKPGELYDQALFVTCNLSIRREAVLEAGNFDPAFRVSEDTELGTRLSRMGYRVRFEPSACATHEHARFASADLLRRAALYGNATWHLLKKHPQLLGDGSGPFGRLSESDLLRIRAIREQKSAAAESGLAALRALDDLDLAPFWNRTPEGVRPVDAILEKVGTIVPLVYWHFLFETFLAAAACENPVSSIEPAAQLANP